MTRKQAIVTRCAAPLALGCLLLFQSCASGAPIYRISSELGKYLLKFFCVIDDLNNDGIPEIAAPSSGADGLSSSSYGPEEAFRTLGRRTYLAIGLAAVMATTVFIIAVSVGVIDSGAFKCEDTLDQLRRQIEGCPPNASFYAQKLIDVEKLKLFFKSLVSFNCLTPCGAYTYEYTLPLV
jgi:hypothetical protein